MAVDPQNEKKTEGAGKRPLRAGPNIWLLVIVLVALAAMMFFNRQPSSSRITYQLFFEQLEKDNIAEVNFGKTQVKGVFREPPVIMERNDAGELVPKKDTKGEPVHYRKNFWYHAPEMSNEGQLKLEETLAARDVQWDFVEESDPAQTHGPDCVPMISVRKPREFLFLRFPALLPVLERHLERNLHGLGPGI